MKIIYFQDNPTICAGAVQFKTPTLLYLTFRLSIHVYYIPGFEQTPEALHTIDIFLVTYICVK